MSGNACCMTAGARGMIVAGVIREEAVAVGHVDQGAAFDTVLVAHTKPDVILHVEFPQAFVILEGEAE